MLPFLKTKNHITVYIDGQPHSFDNTDINIEQVKEAINNNDTKLIRQLSDKKSLINEYTSGHVIFHNGKILYKNKETDHIIATTILEHIKDGLPFKHLMLFLENLFQNPSYHSIRELYRFLEHHKLPITDDGCFLGYKRVNDNGYDLYSGKILYTLGQKIEIERNTVDDDWRNDCSNGIHVGCLQYVRNFNTGTGQILIVKVNPKDVVSVPPNETTKLRTCALVPLSYMTEELKVGVYDNQSGTPISSQSTSEFLDKEDEDLDEEDCDDIDYEDDDDDENYEQDDDDWEDDVSFDYYNNFNN